MTQTFPQVLLGLAQALAFPGLAALLTLAAYGAVQLARVRYHVASAAVPGVEVYRTKAAARRAANELAAAYGQRFRITVTR